MKKSYLLGGLLAIQALAAYLTLSGGNELQGPTGIQKLLEFNREQVDRIRVEDNDGNLAELKRKNDTWLTPEDFPVDTGRVDRLLDQLAQLKHGLAVARSPNAAKRFEVSEDHFQRHLKLLQDGQPVAEFYLGTGAGARRNHIRLADQERIYAARIGDYDLPVDIADWQDKDRLQIKMDEIQSVQLDHLTIRRAEPSKSEGDNTEESKTPEWLAEGLFEGETFKAEEFDSRLRNLATLRYDRAFRGSIEGQEIQTEINVSYGDSSRTYKFVKSKEEDGFWLKVSGHDNLFEINQYTGDLIIKELTKDKLIEKRDSVEEEPTTEETDDHSENISGTEVS